MTKKENLERDSRILFKTASVELIAALRAYVHFSKESTIYNPAHYLARETSVVTKQIGDGIRRMQEAVEASEKFPPPLKTEFAVREHNEILKELADVPERDLANCLVLTRGDFIGYRIPEEGDELDDLDAAAEKGRIVAIKAAEKGIEELLRLRCENGRAFREPREEEIDLKKLTPTLLGDFEVCVDEMLEKLYEFAKTNDESQENCRELLEEVYDAASDLRDVLEGANCLPNPIKELFEVRAHVDIVNRVMFCISKYFEDDFVAAPELEELLFLREMRWGTGDLSLCGRAEMSDLVDRYRAKRKKRAAKK